MNILIAKYVAKGKSLPRGWESTSSFYLPPVKRTPVECYMEKERQANAYQMPLQASIVSRKRDVPTSYFLFVPFLIMDS